MGKHSFIGSCEKCEVGLFPEDFNLGGAVRTLDGQMFCAACAAPAEEAAAPRPSARSGDTVVFSVVGPAPGELARRMEIACMGCGNAFPATVKKRHRYVFCPECGMKMRMETK